VQESTEMGAKMKGNNKISYRNLIILIVVIILLIIIGISITMARYKSTGETTVSAEVAFMS
jgi:cytosine/uracil/thiamine/allantoin permease